MLLVLSATYLYLNPKLPPVDVLREAKLQIPLRIYSQNGELIGEFGEKFRTPIKMSEVPQDLINAILAAEDDRFLKHQGIDIAGLVRAALELVRTGEIQTGGSTITMQVARNFFLSKEKSFVRKFNEILLSLKIERLFTKNEILELYFNKIYLGKRAYGIQAAAAVYYGKSIQELSLAELAMIAGLPKAPSSFNPINNPDRAKIRRDWILGRMHKLGYIDKTSWQTAAVEPITAKYHGPKLQLPAGYAAEMARAFAVDKFGLQAYSKGLKIFTTINAEHQRSAKKSIVKGLDEYTQRHGYRGPEETVLSKEASVRQAALKQRKESNRLIPALVTSIDQQTAAELNPSENTATLNTLTLLLADGQTATLNWDPENDSVRKYITENRRSGKITNINDILKLGDIIRIRVDNEGKVKLAQLPQASASLVALNPANGAISALVGGYDFMQSKFNRVTQARRQPGSNFKPFIYAAAFENGHTAASIINDAPIVFNDDKLETNWRPENSSGKFYGPTTLRRALYLSRNLVSVRLLRELGIQKAITYLEQFELKAGRLPRDLSLALGSYAMTPLDVAKMYATIANGGYKIEPHIVDVIYSRDNRILYKANPPLACEDCVENQTVLTKLNMEDSFQEAESLIDLINQDASDIIDQDSPEDEEELVEPVLPVYAQRIMDERVAYILDNILQDVIKRGTGTKARALGRNDLAGKTGTTNGPTDAWFSGYHPQLAVTTWLGFDDNQYLGKREYGGSAALPIWMSFMREALANVPEASREQPQGLRSVKIDRLTGRSPTAQTTETLFEMFREELAPKQKFNSHAQSHERLDEALSEDLF